MIESSKPHMIERDEEISLLALGVVLLRWRRMIVAFGLVGGALGLAVGLLSTRMYVAGATFIPEGSDNGTAGGLALAASQFGISVPAGSGSWGPPIYVELLRSRALLEPVTLSTIQVAEQGGKSVPLMDVLGIGSRSDTALRKELAVIQLRRLVKSAEVKSLNAVRLTVTTPWPSVSLAISRQLVEGVTRFNRETRKSQATAERAFVDTQAVSAEQALRTAEERLVEFDQRNRFTGSPALAAERARLQRDVSMRLGMFTTMVQNREEARIREVRNTPVITLIEEPRMPVSGEARRSVTKAIIGGFAGVVAAVFIALVASTLSRARRVPREDHQEFFTLIEEVKPRFLRRGPRERL